MNFNRPLFLKKHSLFHRFFSFILLIFLAANYSSAQYRCDLQMEGSGSSNKCIPLKTLSGNTYTVPKNTTRWQKDNFAVCMDEFSDIPPIHLVFIMDNSSSMKPDFIWAKTKSESGDFYGGASSRSEWELCGNVSQTYNGEKLSLNKYCGGSEPSREKGFYKAGDPYGVRLEAFQQAVRTLAERNPKATAGYISFAGHVITQVKPLALNSAGNVNKLVLAMKMENEIGTVYSEPLFAAEKMFADANTPAGESKYIVFLSDGEPENADIIKYAGLDSKYPDVYGIFLNGKGAALDDLRKKVGGPTPIHVNSNKPDEITDAINDIMSNVTKAKTIDAISLKNKAFDTKYQATGKLLTSKGSIANRIQWEHQIPLNSGKNTMELILGLTDVYTDKTESRTVTFFIDAVGDSAKSTTIYKNGLAGTCQTSTLLYAVNAKQTPVGAVTEDTKSIHPILLLSKYDFLYSETQLNLSTEKLKDSESITYDQIAYNRLDKEIAFNGKPSKKTSSNNTVEEPVNGTVNLSWQHPWDPRDKAELSLPVLKSGVGVPPPGGIPLLPLSAVKIDPPTKEIPQGTTLSVTATQAQDATIYYLLVEDAKDVITKPDKSLKAEVKVYSGPITVTENAIYLFVAEKKGYTRSSVTTAIYTVKTQATTPQIEGNGIFTDNFLLTVKNQQNGGTTYVTLNGNVPTDKEKLVSESGYFKQSISAKNYKAGDTLLVKAITYHPSLSPSKVVSRVFVYKPDAPLKDLLRPTVDTNANVIVNRFPVHLIPGDPKVTIYFTLDGTEPDPASVQPSDSNSSNDRMSGTHIFSWNDGDEIWIDQPIILKAIAIRNSKDTSAPLTVLFSTPFSAPAITPDGGKYRDSVQITLSHADPDADIWYTVDGKNPVPEKLGKLYAGPFSFKGQTVKAIAVKKNYIPSGVVQADFESQYLITPDSAVVYDNSGDGFADELILFLPKNSQPLSLADITEKLTFTIPGLKIEAATIEGKTLRFALSSVRDYILSDKSLAIAWKTSTPTHTLDAVTLPLVDRVAPVILKAEISFDSLSVSQQDGFTRFLLVTFSRPISAPSLSSQSLIFFNPEGVEYPLLLKPESLKMESETSIRVDVMLEPGKGLVYPQNGDSIRIRPGLLADISGNTQDLPYNIARSLKVLSPQFSIVQSLDPSGIGSFSGSASEAQQWVILNETVSETVWPGQSNRPIQQMPVRGSSATYGPGPGIHFEATQPFRLHMLLYSNLGEFVSELRLDVNAEQFANLPQSSRAGYRALRLSWNGVTDRGVTVATGVCVYNAKLEFYAANKEPEFKAYRFGIIRRD